MGASLRVKDSVQAGGVTKVMDTDMAEAAVCLYKKLDSGIREKEGEKISSCTRTKRNIFDKVFLSISTPFQHADTFISFFFWEWTQGGSPEKFETPEKSPQKDSFYPFF